MGKTFTDATVTQVLTRIKEEIENNSGTGSVKYDEGQTLTDNQKTQARENIDAASATEVNELDELVQELNAAMQNLGVLVSNVSKTEDGKSLRIDFSNDTSKTINIETEMALRSVEYDENYYLHFLDESGEDLFDPVYIQGGGGTVVQGSAKIDYVSPSAQACVYGNEMIVEYTFTAKDAEGDPVEWGGTGTWLVGNVPVVRNVPVNQGTNTFDIGPYLQTGENNVKLSVSIDVGGESNITCTKTWRFTAVRMYFEWEYNDAQINTGSFTDYWTVHGDIEKTTHTLLDGVAQPTQTTSQPTYTQSMRISGLSHGTHTVERWLSATINEEEQTTEHQYHEIIYAVAGNTTPIIAMSMKTTEMNQYDTLAIPVVIYNPSSITTTAVLSVNGTEVDTWTDVDRTTHYWYYTPSEAGAKNLTVRCGNTTRSVLLTVNAVDINVHEVEGYSFRFKASDFLSNNAVRAWNSEGVTATFSDNFDWVNGGLQTETDDNGNVQQYVCVKAGTTMTINHALLENDPKATGMTFKIIFKVTRCRDYDAEFLTCYSNERGIKMSAHKAYFNSSGEKIDVPYNEDEYIELEFDAYPASDVRYMMAWLDGVITSCREYGTTDAFTTPEKIVIGSPDCDVYVYMVKSYPFRVTRDQHIDNFIMDAPNAAEVVKRYNRNDILDGDSEISYEKLISKAPDARVWLYNIPYLTTGKKDKVKNCEFQQFWNNGTQYYQMSGVGTMTVQGTSSINYIKGAANTDINFSQLYDGNGNDLLASGTEDETYGNNLFFEDSENPGHAKVFTVAEARQAAGIKSSEELGAEWVPVERTDDEHRTPTKYIRALGMKLNDDSCPVTYVNTKVNFASCEQVNNMCNAAWYQRYNPYPSLTARDCMEFTMGVQFIKDSGSVPDDSHFVLWGDNKYHMYSIANMGNSKKNVHVLHDLSNPTDVCIEVNDNDKDQMRMVNPNGLSREDYFSSENWSGDVFYGMRFPDTKNPGDEIKNAWYDLVWWMAESNPNAATGNALAQVEHYDPYTFKGHDRDGLQVLKGTTITQYAGDYTHDTFERRMAKMLSECEDHMVMDSFVYHFVYLERHTMVDNVSKNNFWSSTDLVHWDLSKAYDMDTSDGNNNQGQLVFDYGLEADDVNPTDGKTVFNGSDSVWFVFISNLYEACQTMFLNREAAGAWSAAEYHKFLTTEQQKIPERCWVQCYWYDYLRTHEQNLGAWIDFLDGGQKTHQRRHYETYEEYYDSSKYRGSVSSSNKIDFRAYTPPYWGGVVSTLGGAQIRRSPTNSATAIATVPTGEVVNITAKTDDNWRAVSWNGYEGYMLIADIDALEPKGQITVTMYNKMYIGVTVGTTALDLIKAERGVPVVVNFDYGGLTSNTVINVFSAPMIQAVTGIEQLYPDTCNFTGAVRLRELSIGSAKTGYSNQNLRMLTLSTNVLLEHLYVQNQPNATSVLDLSNCPALLTVDATGSGFTGYEFANGGLLEEAILQAPTSLSLRNLLYLTDEKFTINDYSKLITLWHENTPGVSSLNLVTNATNLQIARILGVDWSVSNTAQLERLVAMQGLDENGYTISQSVMTGEAYTLVITKRNYDRFNEAWPNLIVTYPEGGMVPQSVVTFMNADGNPIFDKDGNEYVQYIDYGEEAYDPIAAEEINTPTREATQQYTFEFSGWDNLSGAVTMDKTVTAIYNEIPNTYTVRWYLDSGMEPAKTVTDVSYGTEAVYVDDTHEQPTIQNQYGTYKVFKGWNKSTGYITGNTDVYAVWLTGTLPASGKELKDMTVPEIYAVAQADMAKSYWSPKDYIDIRMGNDYDFVQGTDPGCVNSQIVAEDLYIDGTSSGIVDTGLKLFDDDAGDWTLAIDYEFNISTSSTLASCYDDEAASGFRLRYYNSAPTIDWSGSRFAIGGSGYSRGMVVLRHIKGSAILYVASDNFGSNGYNWNVTSTSITSAKNATHDGTLKFGGISLKDGGVAELAPGWIHWCKIWYADLGPAVMRQIANWPRETYRWEFDMPGSNDSTGRYLLASGSESCKASFWMNSLVSRSGRMNNTNTNVGGWNASLGRTFANSRVYGALPTEWQSILATVRITGSAGDNSSDILYSNDKVYMPARGEVFSTTSEPYASEAPQGAIRYATSQRTRIKYPGLTIPEDHIYVIYNTDPSAFLPPNPGEDASISGYTRALKDGDLWATSTSSASLYYYISPETAAKHTHFGGRSKGNLVAASAEGAYWVPASYWFTRSPYYWSSGGTAASQYFVDIYYGYTTTNSSASGYYGQTFGFSI